MLNLKEGKIKINNIELNKKTTINEIQTISKPNEIEIRKRLNNKITVQFLNPVNIGSKNFNVSIIFKDEKLIGIDLNINDKNIGEYDYEQKLEEHSKWLIEQIGYPEGVLSVNEYSWGKIIQWDDYRSCTAGISILYF